MGSSSRQTSPKARSKAETQSDKAHRLARWNYYRAHLALTNEDIKAACRVRDFAEVENLFNDLGVWMIRHPDSLRVDRESALKG